MRGIRLHPLHRFQADGRWYVCDVAEGIVLDVGEQLWHALDWGGARTLAEIATQLGETHSHYERQVILDRLRSYVDVGILGDYEAVVPPAVGSQIRVLVLHDLLTPAGIGASPTAIAEQIGCVSRSLARCDVRVPVPVGCGLDGEALARIATVLTWDMSLYYRNLRSLDGTYDAIVDLSTESGFVLPLYEAADIPVVSLYPGVRAPRLEGVLAKCTLARAFDAILMQSSWETQALEGILAVPTPCYAGAPLAVTQTDGVADADGPRGRAAPPVVHLLLPHDTTRRGEIVERVARTYPSARFLVHAASTGLPAHAARANVGTVPWESLDQTRSGDTVFAWLGWGVTRAKLAGLMAHGSPLVVAGPALPSELTDACYWVDSCDEMTPESVTRAVAEALEIARGDPNDLERLSRVARSRASAWASAEAQHGLTRFMASLLGETPRRRARTTRTDRSIHDRTIP